jgi:hypothetical protein
MSDFPDSPWCFSCIACTLWLFFGLAAYVITVIMILKSPSPRATPDMHGGPNYITFFFIIVALGPIPLILLAIDWRRARRRKPPLSPSEFWASGRTNRTWSQDREKK